MSSVRGRILTLYHHEKDYTVLHIQYNIPFKSKYLKFYLLDASKLGNLKEGDDVLVDYHGSVLDEIKRTDHVECKNCKTFLEVEQPHGCENAVKRQPINKQLTLVEKSIREFKFSKGLCFKFSDAEDEYYARIFENSPLFTKFMYMDMGLYNVVGWRCMYNNIDIVQMI